jgi:O-antigen ligase
MSPTTSSTTPSTTSRATSRVATKSLHLGLRSRGGAGHSSSVVVAGAIGLALLALVFLRAGTDAGKTGLILGVGLLIAMAGLRDSGTAIILWLAASVLSLALNQQGTLSLDRLAFVALVGVWFAEIVSGKRHLPHLGAVEGMMFLYIAIEIGSALAPHEFPAAAPDGRTISLIQFIQTSALVPFTLYVIARSAFGSAQMVRRFLWFLIGFSTYLSLTNIAQFTGLTVLVWPKFILNSTWRNRAPGIFDQPIVTGLMIAIGLGAAVFLASQRGERLRWLAAACAATMGPGIYYTHSRAPLLAAVIIVVGGLTFARGFRTGFAILVLVASLLVAANWSTFTSSDRSKGGISSSSEIDDRLNTIATSQWAIERKPIFGWGLGRFALVNTVHHQQWGHIDWRRGYTIVSHETEFGIATELGLAGLGTWLGGLLALIVRVGRSWRALPRSGLTGRGFGTMFFLSMAAWMGSGTTFDLRFFQIINAVIFMWAGTVVALADHDADSTRSVTGQPTRFPMTRRWT